MSRRDFISDLKLVSHPQQFCSTPTLNFLPNPKLTTQKTEPRPQSKPGTTATMSAENLLKTYRGNCHCGAFVYEVELPEIKAVSTCNCSICSKKGYLWAKPSEIKVVKGSEDALTAYTFASNTYYHKVSPLFKFS